ncbi:MAG: hypothetical protein AAFV43_11860 [Planctomycetota bacterium]
MRRVITALTFALALPGIASATILDSFNAGDLIVDFQFDDAMATAIEAVTPTVGAAFDADADFGGAATNGAGQFDGSGKANTAFGSSYSDVTAIDSGRVLGLFEVSWAFDESIFDPAQDEEFRLTLVTNDPRSTFVTGETFFQRTSATEVTLFGNAVGTGSADTADIVLGSSGSLLTIIDANLGTDTLDLYYSADGGATFLASTTGTLNASRGVESVRLVLNEDFSDDTLLVERFAVATVIPEPTTATILLATLALGSTRRRG